MPNSQSKSPSKAAPSVENLLLKCGDWSLDSKSRTFLISAVLVVVTFALYSPVTHFDFLNTDDGLYVKDNFHIQHGFSRTSLAWCFQAGYSANWHPLTWMSHMLDCSLYGLHPGPHHVTNVILHVLNSILVFLLLQRLTRAPRRSAIVAALFAWHPMHVESVAWIAERKDVLSTFFALLTLWAYIKYASSVGRGSRRPDIWCALAIVCFALAIMSKPMVVTLPFVMLLLDWWPLQRCQKGACLGLISEKLPFFVFSAFGCVMTVIAQGRASAFVALQLVPIPIRIYNALFSYVRYIEKLAVPTKLAFIYPIGSFPSFSDALWAGLILIAVTTVAFLFRRPRPYLLMGWFWFLGTLVPVIGLVQVGFQTMADRYTYVPSLGLFIIAVWGISDLAVIAASTASPRRFQSQIILASIVVAMLTAYVVAARQQVQYWKNSETLLQHAIQVVPDNYFAHATYAAYFVEHNRLEDARREAEASLRIKVFGPPHLWLGVVDYREGKYDEAADQFEQSKTLNPTETRANHYLGEVRLAQNRPAEAAEQFSEELRADPDNPWAHCWRGKALARESKYDQASSEFKEALAAIPNYPEAHYELARILQQQHRTQEAIAQYRAAVQANPSYPEALNNLAWVLASNPRPEIRNGPEAVEFATRACELTQYRIPFLIGTLAAADAEAGRFDDAVAMAQKAHDLAVKAGNSAVAARNLELLQLYRAHRPYHEQP